MTELDMTRVAVRAVDIAEWNSTIARWPTANYRQLGAYASELAALRGATVEFLLVEQDGVPIGGAAVRIKAIRILGASLAYVSGGPLTARAVGAEGWTAELQVVVRALEQELCVRRSSTFRIALPLGSEAANGEARSVLALMGFAPSQYGLPYRTLLVPLAGGEQAVRAALDQKWRNQLNSAERKSLTVEHDVSDRMLARFEPLFHSTQSRKGFAVDLEPSFFARVQSRSSTFERYNGLFARENGVDVAAMVVAIHGDTAVYLLGGNSDVGMKLKAAYLLQWAAIRLAINRNCTWYDLGGIDPDANPGVFHFKSGLRGFDTRGVGPLERRPSGVRGLGVSLAERAYRTIRGRA